MKKIILSFSLAATTLFAFAQKPAAGDHSFTFGMTGINTVSVNAPHYTGTLLFKHYLKDDMALRLGVTVGTTSNKLTQAGYMGTDSLNNSSSSSSWGLTLGAQKMFKGTDKLETYIGADLLIGSNGSKSNNMTTWAPNTTTTVDTKNGSNMKFGLMPCIGMNYYIAKWLAVGAEFSYGFISSSTAEGTITTTNVISGVTTTTTSKAPKSSASGLTTGGSGMITVTAAFH